MISTAPITTDPAMAHINPEKKSSCLELNDPRAPHLLVALKEFLQEPEAVNQINLIVLRGNGIGTHMKIDLAVQQVLDPQREPVVVIVDPSVRRNALHHHIILQISILDDVQLHLGEIDLARHLVEGLLQNEAFSDFLMINPDAHVLNARTFLDGSELEQF